MFSHILQTYLDDKGLKMNKMQNPIYEDLEVRNNKRNPVEIKPGRYDLICKSETGCGWERIWFLVKIINRVYTNDDRLRHADRTINGLTLLIHEYILKKIISTYSVSSHIDHAEETKIGQLYLDIHREKVRRNMTEYEFNLLYSRIEIGVKLLLS